MGSQACIDNLLTPVLSDICVMIAIFLKEQNLK